MRRDAAELLKAIRLSAVREPGKVVTLENDFNAGPTLRMLLDLLQGKLTRAEKRERNKAEWSAGNRARWGGENRRGWAKRRGTHRYKGHGK